MLKTVIKLKDGTMISSGNGKGAAVLNSTLIQCVNSGDELTLGSTCANELEVTLLIPEGDLQISAGDEVKVYKQDDAGILTPSGIFILEKPTRSGSNTLKLTGYDRVTKLDMDLSAWLAGLTAWPYKLTDFAQMVCAACGLDFVNTTVPNGDFFVPKFTASGVTGRQIMQWLGEICCRFCRADADGNIGFGWYEDSGKEISATGELYYFQNGLTRESYTVERVGAVQIRLADSSDGALWPKAAEGTNSYIISGNPILNANVTESVETVLNTIRNELAKLEYTPANVTVPANVGVCAGHTVRVADKSGQIFTTCVMTKTQSGQTDTLESTGSIRRDSSAAANNKTSAQKNADSERYANVAAQSAVNAQTQEDVFKKLTDNGKLKGLYMHDGELYINASYLQSGVINADLIKTGTLNADLVKAGTIRSADEDTYFNLENGEIVSTASDGTKVIVAKGGIRLYDAEGVKRVVIEGSDTGYGVHTYGGNGMISGGFEVFGDNMMLRCPYADNSAFVFGKRIGWKEIGDETYLVAY